MTDQYPKRHPNITLETKSENYFRDKIPASWVVYKPNPDYGKDLIIEIPEGDSFKGLELIVQLKSSHTSSGDANFEKIFLRVATYKYLIGNLSVVLLVKYIESEDEAYWTLLRNVSPPENLTEVKTFTVPIPRVNSISTINWESDIISYVRNITDRKLSVNGASSKAGT